MIDGLVLLNGDDLPADLFSLTDDDFYQFVRKRLGDTQARLIEIQRISCMFAFLMTDDICDVLELDIDCEEFDDLKKELCFRLRDGTFLVKPGIRSSFECLKKLMLKKAEEKMKEQSKRKFQRTTGLQVSPEISTSSSTSASSIQTNSTQSSSSSSSESTLDTDKQYLLNLIKKWCQSNKENLDLDDFNLIDGVDFHVNLVNNNNQVEGNIVCKCGVMARLAKCNDKLQLSNYYKHLKDTNCLFMKEMRKKNKKTTSVEPPSLPLAELPTTSSVISTISASSNTLSSQSVSSKRAVSDTRSSSSTRKRRRFID